MSRHVRFVLASALLSFSAWSCDSDGGSSGAGGSGGVGGLSNAIPPGEGGGPSEVACSSDADCTVEEVCAAESEICELCLPGEDCSDLSIGDALSDEQALIEFVDASARFWFSARDDVNGGFYSHVGVDGSPNLARADDRSLVGQSRVAYGMVRAFMLTGDEQFLEQARHALDFHYAHGWDEINDGWYFFSDADGQNPRGGSGSPKWSYFQHYGLLGPTTMCEATRSELDCGWMDKGLQSVDEHLWDSREGYEGYFNHANEDFSVVWAKGFTPTADAVTTHALYAYLVTEKPAHRERFLALADHMVDYLAASRLRDDVVWGFAEEFDDNWVVDEDATFGFVGHVFKTAWSLARAYQIEAKPEYRQAAKELLDHMYADDGFDRDVGAPNSTFLWDSGLMETTKEYWQVEQGFTAGLTNYFISEDRDDRAVYLEIGDRSLSFLLGPMVDPTHGEIYSVMSSDGSRVVDPTKGGTWKAAYHSIETAYYAYLYGNLMVKREPVRLFYRFDAVDDERQIRLNPLAFPDGELLVSAVEFNGQPWTDFDSDSRTLTLGAGDAGVYEVTFERRP